MPAASSTGPPQWSEDVGDPTELDDIPEEVMEAAIEAGLQVVESDSKDERKKKLESFRKKQAKFQAVVSKRGKLKGTM